MGAKAAGLAAVFLGVTAWLPAQWAEESFPLQPGWNAVWLSLDGAHDVPATLLDGRIAEVWRWERAASNIQFLTSPAVPIQADTQWKVWKRAEPAASTLGTLIGNAGYLVRVEDSATPFTFTFKGKPLPPRQEARADGLNFLGFPIVPGASTPDQSVARFFSFSEDLKTNPPIFQYVGGPLSDVAPRNPALIASLTNTPLVRGQAYWVRTTKHSDYYGPLQISLARDSLDFGAEGTILTLRIKNVTDPQRQPSQTVTATLAPAASVAPPVTVPPQAPVAGPVPLKLRGAIDPVTGNFPYTPLNGPVSNDLAPGEEREVVLVADRAAMGTTGGQVFQSLLRITDSLNLTRIDLGVRAETVPLDGVWVGEARVTAVQQILGTREPTAQDPVPQPVRESAAFPLRLVLHRSAAGVTTLLHQVYLGSQATASGAPFPAAGTTEEALATTTAELPITRTARFTSTHFQPSATPLAQSAAFGTGTTATFSLTLPYNHPANPFVHAYHPDHDNFGPLNDVVPPVLPPGAESPTLTRSVTLVFEPPPDGLNDLTWGATTLGGSFSETITGLRKEAVTVTGPFVLKKVSAAPSLRLPPP